jgi:misacylated tRNA(Ala) deacylase
VKKETDPRMHSAEHILNQTMVRMFNCNRSFNAHIEKKKSKCDYHLDHALTEQEIDRIEKQVNAVIEADLPIAEEYLTKEEARQQYNVKRLPRDTGDDIRIVRIGDYDACPCIGSHVASTKEIGIFRIISASFFETGVLRIRFKLGQPESP